MEPTGRYEMLREKKTLVDRVLHARHVNVRSVVPNRGAQTASVGEHARISDIGDAALLHKSREGFIF